MRNHKIQSLLMISALLFCQNIVAGVYKWTDAQGKVHFSDKPHKDAAQIDIKVAKPSGIGTSSNQLKRQKELLLQYQNERLAREKKQHSINKKNAKISAYCTRLKNQILNYEDVDYLYVRNNDGQKRHLTSAQKKQEIQTLKKTHKERCL